MAKKDMSAMGILRAIGNAFTDNGLGVDISKSLEEANKAPVAYPKGHLKPELLKHSSPLVPMSIGYDGAVYGATGGTRNIIWRSDDSLATNERGHTFAEGSIVSVTRSKEGYIVILNNSTTNVGEVYFSEDFSSGFTKVLTMTKRTNKLAVHYYHGEITRLCAAGEYTGDRRGEAHNLYLSLDGGRTWNKTLETPVDDAVTANTHWHAISYDPYTGKLYASNGDGANRRFWESDDLGNNWTTVDVPANDYGMPDLRQPTLMVSMNKKIILTPDTELPPVVYSLLKDENFKNIKSSRFKLKWEHSVYDGESTAQFFAVQPYALNGDELYLVFPSNSSKNQHFIVATGDGGETFHTVFGIRLDEYTSKNMNEGIVGPDKNGYLFWYVVADTAYVAKAKKLEWVRG